MKALRTRLPGVCIDCGAPVTWNGKRWLASPVGRGKGRTHACAVACGTWMPQAGTRCARRPAHRGYHASRYALDNAAAARRKWAA